MSGISTGPIYGTISFHDKTAYLAGRLESVRNGRIGGIDHTPFTKRIECGDFVLEPTDCLCHFVITARGGDSTLKNLNLPKRLFSGKGNEVSFKYDGISYVLIKGPSRFNNKNYTFDALMNRIKPRDYAYDDDIPLDHSVTVRQGISYNLSPECKQIYPGLKVGPENPALFSNTKIEPICVEKTKCSRTGLMLTKLSAALPNSNVVEEASIIYRSKDETRFVLGAPGVPDLEILLDKQDLYVTMRLKQILEKGETVFFSSGGVEEQPEQKTFEEQPEQKTFKKQPKQKTFSLPTFYFHHEHLKSIPDEDRITVNFNSERGLLFFNIPYKNNIPSPADVCVSPSPADVCVSIDVGFGCSLGVRTESNWDETLPFTWTCLGWMGQVPVGINFKFVKVTPNGVQWEQGVEGNRCLKGSESLALTSENVKF